MRLIRWTRQASNLLGIDSAVAFVLAGNIWIGVFSLIQLALIVHYLTPAERGVTVNFGSFFQFQVLFDLGFGLVSQQLASHARAFLHESGGGILAGPAANRARLAAIFRLTVRWQAAALVVWVVFMLPAGWFFFNGVDELDAVDWQLAWVVTVVGIGGCMATVGFAKFLSGCGDITPVARVNTLQLMAVSGGFCVAIALGGKLLAYPASILCGLAVPTVWLLLIRRPLLIDLWQTRSDDTPLRWRRDVRPFQWRIAISLVSAQVYNLMNPVALKGFGAAVAGQLGMTLIVTMTIQTLGIAWVETRVPVFGNLIVRKNWIELDRVYRHVMLKSTGFLAALLMVFLALILFVNAMADAERGGTIAASLPPGLQERAREWAGSFLSPIPAAMLALIALVNHLFNVRAAYLRAHCREPYLALAVVQGLALIATMVLAGRFGTINSMIGGYLLWTVALGLGWGGWVFYCKRREWHAPADTESTAAANP